MADPVSVTRNGHRTFLKWHRARRRATDPAFTGRRILEGLAMGASVEVDLVVHAERGFAVLHDHLDIGSETTGTGPAAAHTGAELSVLHLRDNQGRPIPDRVMLLDDLGALLQRCPPHPQALLQLDYKEDQGPLDTQAIAAFARCVTPVAASMILSSGEAEAVAALTGATPGLHVGYDPCHGEAIVRLKASGDFAGFVRAAIADSPRAELIYLHHLVVLEAAGAGYDLVAAFHDAGRRVDAYTINRADEAGRALAERLLALRVDQITTDDPEGLATLLG